MDSNKPTPQDIAAQLKKPEGSSGIEMGEVMNDGNKFMNLTSYAKLDLQKGEHLFEIGLGNGKFVSHVLYLQENVKYTAIDFSKTMVEAAIEFNKTSIENGIVSISEGDIENIPFTENSFDKICTINTLYFWPNPAENAKELLRVLKPKGKLIMAIRPKETMDAMDFTQFGFDKYKPEDALELLKKSGFVNLSYEVIEEKEFNFGDTPHKLSSCYITAYKN